MMSLSVPLFLYSHRLCSVWPCSLKIQCGTPTLNLYVKQNRRLNRTQDSTILSQYLQNRNTHRISTTKTSSNRIVSPLSFATAKRLVCVRWPNSIFYIQYASMAYHPTVFRHRPALPKDPWPSVTTMCLCTHACLHTLCLVMNKLAMSFVIKYLGHFSPWCDLDSTENVNILVKAEVGEFHFRVGGPYEAICI